MIEYIKKYERGEFRFFSDAYSIVSGKEVLPSRFSTDWFFIITSNIP